MTKTKMRESKTIFEWIEIMPCCFNLVRTFHSTVIYWTFGYDVQNNMIEKNRKMIFNQPVNQVTDTWWYWHTGRYSMFMPILYLSSWKWILDLSSYSNFDIVLSVFPNWTHQITNIAFVTWFLLLWNPWIMGYDQSSSKMSSNLHCS